MTEQEATRKRRQRAERAYTALAFDYVRAPIGSRDWAIFYQGFSAALEPEEEPGVRDAGSAFGGRRTDRSRPE